MTTMQTVLGVYDFFIIGIIVLCFAGASYVKGPDARVQVLVLQVRELQKRLDALLKHQGIEIPTPPPSGLSPEVELLASDPDTKIAAIKLYRKQSCGVGLREAKEKIEAFHRGRQ
jgi:hypothetical protein